MYRFLYIVFVGRFVYDRLKEKVVYILVGSGVVRLLLGDMIVFLMSRVSVMIYVYSNYMLFFYNIIIVLFR